MSGELFWRTMQEPGFEHLILHDDGDVVRADGIVLGVFDEEPRPFRLRYGVACDARFIVRSVDVELLHPWQRRTVLHADGNGVWHDERGQPLDELAGCRDVDIMTTPFTNTLPIRRLAWAPGRTHDIAVAYVSVPSLELSVDHQRYTCLEQSPDTSRFRFASLDSGFTADLLVDADGLVLEYSDIFERVPPP